MMSRGLFGWSPPHIQPLTPVSEVSEPPESPSPYMDTNNEAAGAAAEMEDEMEEEAEDEIEPPPAAVPFSRLFACADRLDWFLMAVGSLAAAAHGTALVVYLHYFAKIIQLLSLKSPGEAELHHMFIELALKIVYIAAGVFAAGWIEVSCWILTGERQTAVIRSKYVQVLLNQDMSFFDTYGNNGDIVSQVLSDVLLIQSALSEKVGNYIHNMATFFSGLVVGFINCWQIALITLATGPFIVAAGGISNIFLHRLAENIQDAYAEASSIAEQVGQAGLSLTKEQKIKLSIARAVLSNPSIILLDEVTGGLDFEAERAVQEALDLLMLGHSTIIIARCLSLIKNADYIAVMEEGQLVEIGTHDELLNLDGLYAELLRCEEAAKLPRRKYKEGATFQIENDFSAGRSFQESSSPKMAKSPSLQRVSGGHVFLISDAAFSFLESPKVRSPPPEQFLENGNGTSSDTAEKEPSMTRQESFEMKLPDLPKIDVRSALQQASNASGPESPVSLLLTSDPENERSHSQTFGRPNGEIDDMPIKLKGKKNSQNRKPPSFWRLVELSRAEWLYAVLGSIGAAIFGSFNPLLAYVIALIVTTYYRFAEGHHI